MKKQTQQTRFYFSFKGLAFSKKKLDSDAKLVVRRKDKTYQSKAFKFDNVQKVSGLSQQVEFPTTVDFDPQTQKYLPKQASIQLLVREAERKIINSKIDQICGIFVASSSPQTHRKYIFEAEIELSKFMNSESGVTQTIQARLTSAQQAQTVEIQFSCRGEVITAPTGNPKSAKNLFASTTHLRVNNLMPSETEKPEPQEQPSKLHRFDSATSIVSSKSVGTRLLGRRKEKTLTFAQPANEYQMETKEKQQQQPKEAPPAKIRTGKKHTTFHIQSQRKIDADAPQANDQQEQPQLKTLQNIQLGRHRSQASQKTSGGEFEGPLSVNNGILNSQTPLGSLEEVEKAKRQMTKRIKQLQTENANQKQQCATLTLHIKQLQESLSNMEMLQKSGDEGRQKIVRRLNEQIDKKNAEIREKTKEIEHEKNRKKQVEEQLQRLRMQYADVKAERDKFQKQLGSALKQNGLTTKSSLRSNTPNAEIQRLKKRYEQEIQQLQAQLKQKNQLLACTDNSLSSSQVCTSQACQREKKNIKSQLKSLNKKLEEYEQKIASKDRQIQTYKNLAQDRQAQSNPNSLAKEYERWKAERLILEQQVQTLKEQKASLMNNSGGGKNKEQLTLLKLQSDTLQRELDRLKKSLNLVTRDKETFEVESKQLQQGIMRLKQLLINVLNTVQESGQIQLYQQVSTLIQQTF